MALPGVAKWLRPEGSQVIGQREERDGDACWPQIYEIAANGAWRYFAILPKLAGAVAR